MLLFDSFLLFGNNHLISTDWCGDRSCLRFLLKAPLNLHVLCITMYGMYMLTYMSPAVDTVDVAVTIPAACELPVGMLQYIHVST